MRQSFSNNKLVIRTKILNKWDTLYNPRKKTFFAKLEENAINDYFAKIFEKSILSVCQLNSGKVLEPGCGSGAISKRLAMRNNEVFLLDLSPNALLRAISNFKNSSINCKFTLGDIFQLPFQDEMFDLVFNQGVMEHFKITGTDPAPAIKEIMRVLKKNGTLIIFIPAFFSPLHIIYKFLKIFNATDQLWPYEKQEFLHKKELRKMMESGGCTNVTVKRLWSSLFFSLIGYCKK